MSAALPASPFAARSASLAVALVATMAYANAWRNGFVLDDPGIILHNPLVQDPATAWRAFVQPYWPSAVGGGQYRPLGIVSFALDHAIAGNRAAWFHVVNVAWHAAVVVLVHRLALTCMAPAFAVLAAVIFAVHPVHVEAVANVVGRLELMAAAFGVGAVLAHRRASLAAVPLFAAALASKESAIMVPFLALLVDRLGTPDWRRALRERARLYGAYAAVAAAWVLLMRYALAGTPWHVTSAVFLDHDASTRLLTVLSIVPHYVRLLVVPTRLSSDYEPDVIVTASSITPAVLLGAGVVVAFLVCLALTWRRWPALALGLAWIVVALAPASNVLFPTGVALAERTLYLPSVGLALVVGVMAEKVPPARQRPTVALLCAVLIGLASITWQRTPTWRDARTHAIALVTQHPESYRGHWVAARAMRAANDVSAADREFTIARRIYDRDATLLREAGALALELGRHDEGQRLIESATAIEQERKSR
ncbi:MAG: hypothetical protein IT361_18350 [Gemmatimonadaceae bacterium]|nr:hypothetical protein [Gemmatimonadaceae bacterium]